MIEVIELQVRSDQSTEQAQAIASWLETMLNCRRLPEHLTTATPRRCSMCDELYEAQESAKICNTCREISY